LVGYQRRSGHLVRAVVHLHLLRFRFGLVGLCPHCEHTDAYALTAGIESRYKRRSEQTFLGYDDVSLRLQSAEGGEDGRRDRQLGGFFPEAIVPEAQRGVLHLPVLAAHAGFEEGRKLVEVRRVELLQAAPDAARSGLPHLVHVRQRVRHQSCARRCPRAQPRHRCRQQRHRRSSRRDLGQQLCRMSAAINQSIGARSSGGVEKDLAKRAGEEVDVCGGERSPMRLHLHHRVLEQRQHRVEAPAYGLSRATDAQHSTRMAARSTTSDVRTERATETERHRGAAATGAAPRTPVVAPRTGPAAARTAPQLRSPLPAARSAVRRAAHTSESHVIVIGSEACRTSSTQPSCMQALESARKRSAQAS
jgi:hypothetical protein